MKIIKTITVLMQNSNDKSETYPKRANQLVKKNRAYWVDDVTICMYELGKDILMSKVKNNSSREAKNEEAPEIEPVALDAAVENIVSVETTKTISEASNTSVDNTVLDEITKLVSENKNGQVEKNISKETTTVGETRNVQLENIQILHMATKKVEDKNRFTIAILDYLLLGLFCILMIWFSYFPENMVLISVIYIAFWTVRLIHRAIKIYDVNTKKSIKEQLAEKKERDILSTYKQLLEEVSNPS